MTSSNGPIAVLDTCVLFPAALRDLLLRIGEQGSAQLHWSDYTLVELQRNLINTGRCTTEQATRLLTHIQEAFPEATVTNFATLAVGLTNDPKDRHVVAAARKAGANLIVTHNLRDFPVSALAPFAIKAISPDDYLTDLFNQRPEQMAALIILQARDMKRPPTHTSELLTHLETQAPYFTELVRAWLK